MHRTCLLPALVAALLSASACDRADGHPECRDLASTQAYGLKWQEDLAAASRSGKVTVPEVVEAQGKMLEQLGLLNEERFAEFCDNLDSVRGEVGF